MASYRRLKSVQHTDSEAPVRSALRPLVALVLFIGLSVSLLPACAANTHFVQLEAQVGYFDPHNHLAGVLPWPAYADLPAYIKKLKGRNRS